MRVALVHDWLTGMRGGEKVLDAICELFPEAPLYTFVHVPGSVSPRIEARRIVTSEAQWLPRPARLYRHYLPLYPIAVELMDLDEYDLVISSSHCAVKSVVTNGRALHVCYCHSPMRYAWDQFDAYFGPDQVGRLGSWLLGRVMRRLAAWDASTEGRVDRFLANSQYVAGRIRRYYNRGSTIVYPPVDTDFYSPDGRPTSPSCLIVSALVPYKRVDLAIEACRLTGTRLRIVGTGPELPRLRALAGPEVEFLGWQPDEQVRSLYRESSVTLLPGIEDFGIVPVEAQACGCPVVALDAGGTRETIVDGVTGVLVKEGTPEAFAGGVTLALRTSFDKDRIRANALRFSRTNFLIRFRAAIDEVLNTFGDRRRPIALPPGVAESSKSAVRDLPPDGPEPRTSPVRESSPDAPGPRTSAVRELPQDGPELPKPAVRELPQDGPEPPKPAVRELPQDGPELPKSAVRELPPDGPEPPKPAVRELPPDGPELAKPAVRELPQDGPEPPKLAVRELPQDGSEPPKPAVRENKQ